MGLQLLVSGGVGVESRVRRRWAQNVWGCSVKGSTLFTSDRINRASLLPVERKQISNRASTHILLTNTRKNVQECLGLRTSVFCVVSRIRSVDATWSSTAE